MAMLLLEKLLGAATEASRQAGKTEAKVFGESIGLFLVDNPRWGGYDSTPLNSRGFASTGGDGVHFSFVEIDGEISDDSPIVMTVPMNFNNTNLIVGDTLTEFLALGCRFGYFRLEQLVYQRAKTVAKIESAVDYQCDDYYEGLDRLALNALTTTFRLQLWTNIESRLKELESSYYPLLKFNE